jgi:hypothetical protein
VVLGGTAALSFPAIVLGQAKPVVAHRRANEDLFPDDHRRDLRCRQKLFDKEGRRVPADDLP